MATAHDQHTRMRATGPTSGKRWVVAIAVVVALVIAVALLIVYGGGGAGGTGGY